MRCGDCSKKAASAELQSLLEALTLEAAERESGYGYSALQKMVADGRLENVGVKGRPRVRRCDLPKKGGTSHVGIAEMVLRECCIETGGNSHGHYYGDRGRR